MGLLRKIITLSADTPIRVDLNQFTGEDAPELIGLVNTKGEGTKTNHRNYIMITLQEDGDVYVWHDNTVAATKFSRKISNDSGKEERTLTQNHDVPTWIVSATEIDVLIEEGEGENECP